MLMVFGFLIGALVACMFMILNRLDKICMNMEKDSESKEEGE